MKRYFGVFGFRYDRYGWAHVVLASGSLSLGACVDRAYDFGAEPIDSEGGTATGTGDPTDPSGPTGGNPTSPTDPTTDPTDPTGTVPGVPGPPQLIEIAFLDNLTLELRFNEGMSAPTGVDPTQFRLSVAFGQTQYEYKYGTFTVYQELGYFNGPEQCYENCYDPCKYDYDSGCYYGTGGRMCYEYCYQMQGPPVHGFALELDPAATDRIRLRLDNGIGSGVCGAIGQNGPNFEGGLFLHYTDDGAPLVDAMGEALLPIGERWALMPDEGFYYRPEFFPELDPFLPIPCPF